MLSFSFFASKKPPYNSHFTKKEAGKEILISKKRYFQKNWYNVFKVVIL